MAGDSIPIRIDRCVWLEGKFKELTSIDCMSLVRREGGKVWLLCSLVTDSGFLKTALTSERMPCNQFSKHSFIASSNELKVRKKTRPVSLTNFNFPFFFQKRKMGESGEDYGHVLGVVKRNLDHRIQER